ncbi:MAG TPA: cyclic nucleotide-binding domain-containing protein [Actinomycetota bacterium]|jgi:CRP-like cAMP-binding protein
MHSITHSLIKALKNVPGFDALSETYLVEIAGASVNLIWPAGSHVFEKGTAADALYIVLEGSVRIYDEVDGSEIEIARTGPGEYFGEISLLMDSTHTKNVQACDDTELLVLSKESFGRLLASNPSLEAQFRERSETRRTEAEALYPTATA